MRLFRLRGAPGRPQHLLLALALATAGFLLAGTAQAQIAGTSHDLSTATEGVQANNNLNGEVCAYCHTPHGGDISAPAPLWNRNLASVSITQRYSNLNTTTLRGEEAATVGSISLACLSCHDGVQAMDTVINAPGRGASNNVSDTPTKITGTFTNIGQDLRDDHPVSIQYCGGGIDSADGTTGTIAANGNCAHGTDYNDVQTAVINTNQVWWLDTAGTVDTVDGGTAFGTNNRDRTDIFLYSRSDFSDNADGSAANLQPTVECGSCHDPHVNSENPTNEVNFMRISNSGSEICLTCHNK